MRDVYLDAIPRSTITKATTSTCTLNPTGWSTDMAGANLVGIRDVFGSEAFKRVKTCEFHFKQNHNKKARELHEESAQEFKDSIYMEFHFIGSYIREYKKGTSSGGTGPSSVHRNYRRGSSLDLGLLFLLFF